MLRKLKRKIYNLLHPVVGEVWEFHRVTKEESGDETMRKYYTITPMRLEHLIHDYLKKGYRFVSVEQVQKMVQASSYPYRFIAITLDDGYADNYEIAYPIFKRYNIPFCIFISKDYVLNGNDTYRFLSESQIQKLSEESLCTIGSHTVSHPQLNSISVTDQQLEISQCKEWLEGLVGQQVNYFAYPGGEYNSDTLDVVRQCNISAAFAAWGGPVRNIKHLNKYLIPRIIITETEVIH